MLSRTFALAASALALALLTSPAVWADLAVRYTLDAKFGAAFPAAAADAAKQQIVGILPTEISTQVKASKCANSFGPIHSILDTSKGEITLFNPATKQFATVAEAAYTERILAQQKIPADAQQALANVFQNLKMDVQAKKTGQVMTIQGIQAEDNLMIITMEMASPGVPISIRLEMHQWLATADAASRVPALAEVATCSSAGTGSDPSAMIEKVLGQFPGATEKLGDALKQLAKSKGTLALNTQVQIFAPAVLAMLQAQGGQGAATNADVNAPLVEIDFNLAELSLNPLPDSAFQVPEGFTEAPLEDLIKNLGRPAGVAETQPSAVPAPFAAVEYTGPTVRVGNGVSAPVPIFRPEPKYTEEARKAKIQGAVLLSLVVDTDGFTRNIKVVRSLEPTLDQQAIEVVGTWKFQPGQKDGQPVAVQSQIEVSFKLLDNPPVQ